MIKGISHITFVVKDLDRTQHLLETIFDARLLYDSGQKTFSLSKERFFDIAGQWIAIMEGEPLKEQTYNHVAFKISPADYDAYLKRLRSLSLEFREGRPRVAGEGRSIYFYDYDNHLLELHTGTLEERLETYRNS